MHDGPMERLLSALSDRDMDWDDDYQPVAKLDADAADYTSPGPEPFVCRTCCYWLHDDTCEIVEGPYPGGKVEADDTCRFFKPLKPKMRLTPIKSEEKD